MVLGLLFFITAIRLAVIVISPLGPGVDEAQYWLWGQNLQFGYSKPPLIAWLLGMVDAMFGNLHLPSGVWAHPASDHQPYFMADRPAYRRGLRGRIAALLWLGRRRWG